MNQDKHIFPVIFAERDGATLKLNTFVRIKYRGKWYLREFNRNAYVPQEQNNFTAAISSFNRDIYQAQLSWKVETKLKNSEGELLYPLDEDQRSEEERLKPII